MRPADLTTEPAPRADLARSASGPAARPRRKAKAAWLKQLHAWHWVSAAVSLIGMLLFAITGITLNHADLIGARPRVTDRAAMLPATLLPLLKKTPATADAPLPDAVARAIAARVDLDPAGRAGEWNDDEVYIAMPRPGGDAWVSVDRTTGAIKSEVTDQGPIALLNDLHKGRNTGLAWRLFIDVFAAAAILFTLTGLLLLQLHARHRRLTWPLVGLGLLIPLVLFVFFLH